MLENTKKNPSVHQVVGCVSGMKRFAHLFAGGGQQEVVLGVSQPDHHRLHPAGAGTVRAYRTFHMPSKP